MAVDVASEGVRRSPWIRGPAWDLALLSLPWVPFYIAFVFGLHLGHGGIAIVRRPEFATALLVVLGLIFAHRHYVFLMVYGDRQAFQARPRSFIGAALFIVGATIVGWELRDRVPMIWDIVFVTGIVWNIWHSIMQRYGIVRIYAGRAGAGLQAAEHARRDRRLLWSAVALVATALVVTRTSTLDGHPTTEAILRGLRPMLAGATPKIVLGVVMAGFAASLFSWARAELAAPIAPIDRLPRLTFIASTFALLAILYVHGPIIGYLVFATAHAIEYIAFVHHFAARNYADRRDSFAARLLARPLRAALVIVPASFFLYLWMRLSGLTVLAAFILYEVSAAMVHFAYDGWVWKARSPSVSKPLDLAPALFVPSTASNAGSVVSG